MISELMFALLGIAVLTFLFYFSLVTSFPHVLYSVTFVVVVVTLEF